MKTAAQRFLDYISYDTGSDSTSGTFPSTAKQKVFAAHLVQEMKELGISDAHMDEYGYVYGSVPSNCERKLPVIGLISHMDTVSDPPSAGIRPRIIRDYDGGDVVLNQEKEIVLRTADYPSLFTYQGQDLIVGDGTTILGGDDKAGIAAILTGVEQVLADGAPHGAFCIAFTPDEEIGRGTKYFDVEKFGADFAFTLDGGKLGDYQYESFNGAQAEVVICGRMCHLGRGKSRGLRNSIRIAMEFQSMLPVFEDPANTEKHEGYYHLDRFDGRVALTRLLYRINDHSREKFEQKKALLREIAGFLNRKYGEPVVQVSCEDICYNMYDRLKDKGYILDRVRRALCSIGVMPNERPVRGSTDGAKLSYMGLPCPNLCMGSENAHSIYEFSSVQALAGVSRMVCALLTDLTPPEEQEKQM